MKQNTGHPEQRDQKSRVKNKKSKFAEGNSSSNPSASSKTKENLPPYAPAKKILLSPPTVVIKTTGPSKTFILKDLPGGFEDFIMTESDEELYAFFDRSGRRFPSPKRPWEEKRSDFQTTFRRPSSKRSLEGKKSDLQTTFHRPSPKQPLEEKRSDFQATFRRPSPIKFSQPIEKDSIEDLNRKTFQRPSPIRSFGQDNHGASFHKSDTFIVPSISKNEPEIHTMKISQSRSSSNISQFTELPGSTKKKYTTEIIDVDDELFNSSGRLKTKSNVTKAAEKHKKSYIRTNNSSVFINSSEAESAKAELKTKNIQLSLIDNFYEPSKKHESFQRPRKDREQSNNRFLFSKHNANDKPGVVKDRKSVEVVSRDEKVKRSPINKNKLHNSRRQVSSDDDFIITKPKDNSKNKRNDISAWSPQSITDDDDFLDNLPPKNDSKKKKNVHSRKKRNNFRVLPNQSHSDDDDFVKPCKQKCDTTKKRHDLHVPQRKANVSDEVSIEISSNKTVKIVDDESKAHKNQKEEFKVPSPPSNKYANLPEMDLLSEEETSNSQKTKEDSTEYEYCPFCNEPIPLPLPKRIRVYLSKINPSARNKLSDQTRMPSPSVLLQHSLNIVDQFEFCRLHDAETRIVPEGLKNNYPISIDFDHLPERIEKLIPELMLIIKGKCKSLYRDLALNAYQEFGRARARKPTILMGRFQKFQPGYYGSKGASIIFSSLISLLMDTNVLTMEMTKPQVPLEYLNQVIIPETAIRLISQDRGGISLEEAGRVMEDSVEFGMYVHDIDEVLDE